MSSMTNEYIDVAQAKALREALLLSLIVNRGLLIDTAEPSTVPPYPGYGWGKVLDNDLQWQALQNGLPLGKVLPDRPLARIYDGKPIQVLTSEDPVRHIISQVHGTARKVAAQPAMPEITGNVNQGLLSGCALPEVEDAPPRETMHVLMRLPERDVPESILAHMVYSYNARGLPPSAVRGLIDFIMFGAEFSPDNIAHLRAKQGEVVDAVAVGADKAFLNRIVRAIRATRPDTEEFMERVGIGILPTFGLGASPRANLNLLHVCAANAVINGRDYVTSDDLVHTFPKVLGHAFTWGAARPAFGTEATLEQIADWAVST